MIVTGYVRNVMWFIHTVILIECIVAHWIEQDHTMCCVLNAITFCYNGYNLNIDAATRMKTISTHVKLYMSLLN